MPVGMFVYSREDGRLEPNPALARMFGHQGPAEMMMSRLGREFLVDEGERKRLLNALIRDGAVSNFVSFTKRFDGRGIWVSIDARAVISGRTVERIEGIARDITDQVKADSERRSTEDRLASLIREAPIVFVAVDREFRFTHLAGDFFKIIDMEPSAMVGQPLSRFFAARPDIMARFSRAVAGETFSGSGTLGGRQFHVQYRPLLADSGAVNGALMVAVDVTERAQAEAVAEVNRERLERVLSSAPIMLVTVDGEGIFDYANGDIAYQLGIDLETIVGQHYAVRFKDHPDIADWWRRALGGEAHSQESQRDQHTYLSYFAPLQREGVLAGASMVGLEITDLAEAQRQAATRARYQASVIQVGAAALASANQEQLLQEAMVSMASVLDLPLAAAFEIQHVRDTATIRALVSDTDIVGTVGTAFPLSQLVSYQVLVATGHAMAVDDYDKQTEFSRNALMDELGVRASLAVLIPGAERAVGTIILYSRRPRIWTPYELEFVEIMANMMSVALQRTRAEEQRRLLLSRLVSAQEEERHSIASDIHDDAVQVMTAANMRLEIFRRQLGDAAEGETVERLQKTISLAIQRLRNLLFDLSPPALERYGLVSAVRMALNQLHAESDLEVEVRGSLQSEPDMARRTMVYRVFQEAVANVRKHAQATRLEVTIEDEAGGTTVIISDNGLGFGLTNTTEPRPGHIGITGMRERMELAGGWLKISSKIGGGTTVRLWVPS